MSKQSEIKKEVIELVTDESLSKSDYVEMLLDLISDFHAMVEAADNETEEEE